MPDDLPVVILGSKKHLLSKIFGDPSAPLSGWGVHCEVSAISTKEYHSYINERFSPLGLEISIEDTKFLQDLVQNIPECVNIVCDKIMRQSNGPNNVTKENIMFAFKKVVDERRAVFEERNSRFTEKEETFLTVLAKMEPVKQPNGKSFLRRVNLSPGGNGPIISRLENEAIIYKTVAGYVVNDPLYAEFLRIYR